MQPADSGVPPFEAYEPARWAMGDTRRFAERVGLVDMLPRTDVGPAGFALVNPGVEYLVLQVDGDDRAFTIELAPGVYEVEWFGIDRRETVRADELIVDQTASVVEFTSPVASGPAVLYLSRNET